MMKQNALIVLLALWLVSFGLPEENSWIRINNLGYLPQSIKVAVLGSKADDKVESFSLFDATTNIEVYK